MSRLEAFSDGVIAVIITIMVLELKAPETPEPLALLKLWPSFAIYLVSFVMVAIYWINHHNLLVQAGRVTSRLIWANNTLLFCLSLIPFATAYVADHESRTVSDDGLWRAAVRLRTGLLPRIVDGLSRAAGGSRAP